MSLRKGLARAGRTLDSPRKSLGKGVVQQLTLESPAGWLTGEESVGMSRDRAMKISTVNRCVEVLSNSMAVLPVYIMNERTKERLPDHRLGRVLWERANEAMTAFDYGDNPRRPGILCQLELWPPEQLGAFERDSGTGERRRSGAPQRRRCEV